MNLLANPVGEPSWMPPGLISVADTADHLLKLLGLAAFVYVIGMGLSHRAGARKGQKLAEARREADGKPNLKSLPDNGESVPFWKDQAILQGGVSGMVQMAVLCSYVIIMLAVTRPPAAMLPQALGILFGYPNSMAAYLAIMFAIGLYKLKSKQIYVLTVLSIAAAVLTFVIVSRMRETPAILPLQLLLFTLQTLTISYLLGVIFGVSLTQLEKRFPLVELTTIDGQTHHGLRILKVNDTDCRFIEADGSVCLTPKQNIVRIRTI